MIHFFAKCRDTLEKFVDSWAPELRPHVRTVSYHRLPVLRSPPDGAYIFSDFERLRSWRFSSLTKLATRLKTDPARYRIFNDPARYLSRFQLMRVLHERGINEFQVYRTDETDRDLRFPVFLRSEVDHRGAISGRLNSREEIKRALARFSVKNLFRKKHLMLVEYCDCSSTDGLFRKYSAMNINGTLIPRHVLFSQDWVTKKPDVVTPASVAEEQRFLEEFPHREQLLEIFRLAGVDYGRIDYGLKDGRLQVWEINTNPVIVPRRELVDPRRMPSQSKSARLIAEALLSISR
jgi:hypothetical protein